MNSLVAESGGYAQVAASGNVWKGPTALLGIFVSAATTTPTITVYDDAATGTTTKIVDTFTPVAGTFYRLPFRALKGLNVVISGTVSCTVGYVPATTL